MVRKFDLHLFKSSFFTVKFDLHLFKSFFFTVYSTMPTSQQVRNAKSKLKKTLTRNRSKPVLPNRQLLNLIKVNKHIQAIKRNLLRVQEMVRNSKK